MRDRILYLAAALVYLGLPSCTSNNEFPSEQSFGIQAACSSTITWISGPRSVPRNTTGHQETFVIRNTGTSSATQTVTCTTTGPITCTGVSPSSLTLSAGSSADVTATFNAGSSTGVGVLTLHWCGTGGVKISVT